MSRSTLGAAPSSSTHIGYTLTTSLLVATSVVNDFLPSAAGVLIPSPGYWLINYAVRLTAPNNNGQIGRIFTKIGSPSPGYTTLTLGLSDNSAIQYINSAASVSNAGSGVVNVTNTTTYIYIHVILSIAAGPITTNNTDSYMQFTRIG